MTKDKLASLLKKIYCGEDTGQADGIYLLEPLSENSGFFASNKKLVYMEMDSYGYSVEGIDTEYLKLQTHIRINAVMNNQTFDSGYYNIIIFDREIDDPNLEYFVKICSAYAQNYTELEFKEFFYALISIFQLPTTQNYLNALGLYGELKVIQLAIKNKMDLSAVWHQNGSYSRFDFSGNGINLEVKTTVADDLRVTLKHRQLFEASNCFLAVVNCEECENGETIQSIVEDIHADPTFGHSLNFEINLAKELKRISPRDYSNLRISFRWLSIYDANKINPFPVVPDNVEDLRYKLDVSDFSESSQIDFSEISDQLLH